jgi:hypothetical protein
MHFDAPCFVRCDWGRQGKGCYRHDHRVVSSWCPAVEPKAGKGLLFFVTARFPPPGREKLEETRAMFRHQQVLMERDPLVCTAMLDWAVLFRKWS